MEKLYQLFCVSYFLLFVTIVSAQDAVYKIEFISNWSSTVHPVDYPSSTAHWSSLIGATHNENVSFFEIGQLASAGVELVAETGSKTILTDEINASITNGNTYGIINGPNLSTGTGTITKDNVNADADFPYISLITMIAPSPDWVGQINNIKLTEDNGDWKSLISIDIYATDAGTDSGTTYGSANEDTNPAENISNLQGIAPFSDQIIGTFKITLLQVLGIRDNVLNNLISIYPNPSQGTITITTVGDVILDKAEIYTITGKKLKVFNSIATKNNLTINSLKTGLYFLNIRSNKGSITKKLLIK